MRRLVTTCLALFVLAAPASALAQSVSIEDGGYNPATITIAPGAAVNWQYNNPTVAHGVQFGSDIVCQPGTQLLPPASPCQKAFPDPGRFYYHDVGCDPSTNSMCIQGEVIVYVPPTASFTASPNPQLRGQAVNFDASASTSPGGSITKYEWDFGDGTTGTGVTTSHVYTTAQTYPVTLRVTDDQNNVQVQTQNVSIAIPDSDGDGLNDDVDKCPNVPAHTSDGCPFVPPPIPPPIATNSTVAGELGIAGAIKNGIKVVLNCSDVCNGDFALSYGGIDASMPAAVALATGGSKLVTVPIASTAASILARKQTARLLLTVTVTDALGRSQIDRAWVTLAKVKTYGKLPAIGISDNNPATFNDPNFQILTLKYARLVTPWNSIFTERGRLDGWLQTARSYGIRPLVSFEHARGMVCPGRKCKGPSASQYARAWRAFHKKYPWVKDISPWNEVNSATQPTGSRPDLAATYYNVVRASCRGCSLVAADLLDASNIRRYALAFLAKAKGKPKLWGLHNYTDTNRFRSRGTSALLQTVKGTIWLTETGGVVKFTTQSGKVALPKSESRAKKAMDYMFRLAELNAKRIKRIYVYQWKVNNVFDRFDAGVIRPDGTPRPSFRVLTLNASIAARR